MEISVAYTLQYNVKHNKHSLITAFPDYSNTPYVLPDTIATKNDKARRPLIRTDRYITSLLLSTMELRLMTRFSESISLDRNDLSDLQPSRAVRIKY